MKTLVVALALLAAGEVHADPALVEEEPPPEPLTKLGWRIAFAEVPLDASALLGIGLAIGVDHAVWSELRVIAEYEWLWHEEVSHDHEVSFGGMGHRAHLGLRRELATYRMEGALLYLDGEVGGGLGIYDAMSSVVVLPHGFVGVCAGGQMTKRRARASRTFGFEIQVRAFVGEHGVAMGGGIGLWWGD